MLCLLLEGRKEVTDHQTQTAFDNRQLMLLQAGNCLMTERTNEIHHYESILIFFSNEFLFDFVHGYPLPGEVSEKSDRFVTLEKDDFILHYQQSLQMASHTLQSDEALLKVKLQELLIYLLRVYPANVQAFIDNCLHREAHFSFREVIEQNAGKNLGTEELAFLCNMSLSTFKRRFREIFNMSPGQYFLEQKMQRALQLLQRNHRPSEVYDLIGYHSLSSFSHEFKKHFGVSPGEYRQIN
jgi:AraC-like DNA-binding protein